MQPEDNPNECPVLPPPRGAGGGTLGGRTIADYFQDMFHVESVQRWHRR